MKKIFASVLLILVLASVLFLALQGPAETNALSNRVWQFFKYLGYKGTNHQFRSDFHLIEYFVVGLASILFCQAMGWKIWIGAAMAMMIGLLEETLKIFLPTREFGAADLVKDCIGVLIATVIVFTTDSVRRMVHKIEQSSIKAGTH